MADPNKQTMGAVLQKDGVLFRVWAPFASSVSVEGAFNNWQSAPLQPESNGYWSTLVKGARAGQEYKYAITNGDQQLLKNDPYVRQLTTNNGNSLIIDPHYDWGSEQFQPKPTANQVLYEMHIGTFNRIDPATSGTFETAAAKLDYLADLGVTTIELMPVGSMPEDRGWGYATDYIFAVESLYGGRHGLLDFVKAAHSRDIGVILDVVYNHFGPDDKLDLWQFDGWQQDNKGGIYFYNDDRSTTPWGETRPDYGRDPVRQYILDNVRWWLVDCHLDGLRLDSTIYMRNTQGQNNDPAHDIAEGWTLLQAVTDLARKVNPRALLIAEDSGSNEYLTKATSDGGAGFTAQWAVDFPHLLRQALDSPSDEQRDIASLASRLASLVAQPLQQVVYSDSHDSAANGGARLDEEISPGNTGSIFARRRSLLAAALVLTAPAIPMLFQGQEFMEGGSFNDWQALSWEKSEQFAGIVLAHKHLIALRQNQYNHCAGLLGASLAVLHQNDNPKVLAYHRWQQGGPSDDVVVVLNFSNQVLTDYELPFPKVGIWRVRFNSDWKGYSPDFTETASHDVTVADDSAAITIGPYSALILSQDS